MNFPETKHVGPSHHEDAFNIDNMSIFTENAKQTVDYLRKKFPNLSAIAGMGHSGSIMVGPIAMATKLNPILVRKIGERGVVSGNPSITGRIKAGMDYLIVDDLVSSGSSASRIMREITKNFKSRHSQHDLPVRCIGILTYESSYCLDGWYNTTNGKDLPRFGIGGYFNLYKVEAVRMNDWKSA